MSQNENRTITNVEDMWWVGNDLYIKTKDGDTYKMYDPYPVSIDWDWAEVESNEETIVV